jgi:hypothetical protein
VFAPPLAPTSPGPSLSPETLDRVTQALASHVGPIARVIVKKASADATTYRDLCPAPALGAQSFTYESSRTSSAA